MRLPPRSCRCFWAAFCSTPCWAGCLAKPAPGPGFPGRCCCAACCSTSGFLSTINTGISCCPAWPLPSLPCRTRRSPWGFPFSRSRPSRFSSISAGGPSPPSIFPGRYATSPSLARSRPAPLPATTNLPRRPRPGSRCSAGASSGLCWAFAKRSCWPISSPTLWPKFSKPRRPPRRWSGWGLSVTVYSCTMIFPVIRTWPSAFARCWGTAAPKTSTTRI